MEFYTHRYSDVTDLEKYEVIENTERGQRVSDESHTKDLDYIPKKVSGNRFILIVKDKVTLDPNMEKVLADEKKREDSDLAISKLQELDLKQIRSIAEYIVVKTDAPKELKDIETLKIAERTKLWV
jgi:hypothetical protein